MKKLLEEINILKSEIEYLKYESVSNHIRNTFPGLLGEIYDKFLNKEVSGNLKQKAKEWFDEIVIDADLTYRGESLINQFELLYRGIIKEDQKLKNKVIQ